jgi:hypothetical protein
MAGCLLSLESWDFQAIVLWCLFPAFVIVAVILPPTLLLLLLTFTLVIIPEIVFTFAVTAEQLVYASYRTGLRPRSPPVR